MTFFIFFLCGTNTTLYKKWWNKILSWIPSKRSTRYVFVILNVYHKCRLDIKDCIRFVYYYTHQIRCNRGHRLLFTDHSTNELSTPFWFYLIIYNKLLLKSQSSGYTIIKNRGKSSNKQSQKYLRSCPLSHRIYIF